MNNKKLKDLKAYLLNWLKWYFKNSKKPIKVNFNYEKQYNCLSINILANTYTSIIDYYVISLMGSNGKLNYLQKIQHYYINNDFSLSQCNISEGEISFVNRVINVISDFLNDYEETK